jgi:uncharacterized membrane protein YfcA
VIPFPDLSAGGLALLLLGGLAGGFVNGLTGFGTALSGMPFWLQVVPPALASELAAATGVSAQLATLKRIWHAIDWRGMAPMLIAGLAGVPIGAALLAFIDPAVFKRCVGALLVVYAGTLLTANGRLRLKDYGRPAEVILGVSSGILGGLAGLSGVLPTIWAALVGWPKDKRRGVFQAFNLIILSAMLTAHLAKGVIDPSLIGALLVVVPTAFIGVAAGQWVYARLDDHRFDRAVLWLLGAGGVMLLLAPT